MSRERTCPSCTLRTPGPQKTRTPSILCVPDRGTTLNNSRGFSLPAESFRRNSEAQRRDGLSYPLPLVWHPQLPQQRRPAFRSSQRRSIAGLSGFDRAHTRLDSDTVPSASRHARFNLTKCHWIPLQLKEYNRPSCSSRYPFPRDISAVPASPASNPNHRCILFPVPLPEPEIHDQKERSRLFELWIRRPGSHHEIDRSFNRIAMIANCSGVTSKFSSGKRNL